MIKSLILKKSIIDPKKVKCHSTNCKKGQDFSQLGGGEVNNLLTEFGVYIALGEPVFSP